MIFRTFLPVCVVLTFRRIIPQIFLKARLSVELSAYIGEELYIELHDEVIEGGWAHAFFDEIVTFYEEAPDYANNFETVMDGNQAGEVQIPWQLAENLA